MQFEIDRDTYQGKCYIFFLSIFGREMIFTLRWFRKCPVGWCGYEPYHDMCPLCHDEAVIPWYRGWIFELRRWWAYGPGNRIWEWREKRRKTFDD